MLPIKRILLNFIGLLLGILSGIIIDLSMIGYFSEGMAFLAFFGTFILCMILFAGIPVGNRVIGGENLFGWNTRVCLMGFVLGAFSGLIYKIDQSHSSIIELYYRTSQLDKFDSAF